MSLKAFMIRAGKVTRGLKVALYRKDISVHILSFPGSFG